MTQPQVERFRPTSGRLLGVVGLLLVAVVLGSGLVGGYPVWVLGATALAGVLVWTALLRPAVRLDGDDLVLRTMFGTTFLPLAAIEEVVVSQVLAVRAGERRYVSPAVGHPLRKVVRGTQLGGVGGGVGDHGRSMVDLAEHAYPAYVQQRIRAAVEDRRERLGVALFSAEHQALVDRVRRVPAYAEIGALVASLTVLLGGLLLG